MHTLKTDLEEVIQEKIVEFPVHSGKITTQSGKTYFLKSGPPSPIYQCELNGLNELKKSATIKVCKVFFAEDNYILTEFIQETHPDKSFFSRFGSSLAKLHQYTQPHYGFYEDNFVGLSYQLNIPTSREKNNWIDFYFNKRLLYQFHLAERNHVASKNLTDYFHKLESKIEDILEDSLEPPTLLHGDLWSGNFLCNVSNDPIFIDPAVYYGHREADLAMTKLFGGFPDSFYKAYQDEYPLLPGWEYREGIYKLYHVLNHLNLFGRTYLSAAEQLIKQYI